MQYNKLYVENDLSYLIFKRLTSLIFETMILIAIISQTIIGDDVYQFVFFSKKLFACYYLSVNLFIQGV